MNDDVIDPVIRQLTDWIKEGHATALATVVETWGSSPCPAGSKMAVNGKAAFAGSVSGGCIETSVVSEALEIIREGGFEVLGYGISDEQGAAAGLACGGTIRVLVEPVDQRLLALLSGPRPVARIVDLGNLEWGVLAEANAPGSGVEGLSATPAALVAATKALGDGRVAHLVDGDREFFIDPIVPNYRMIIVGAVAIAQVLAPMARAAGFDVVIVDPRPTFATEQRFPDCRILQVWPDKAMADLRPDRHTAVVTLTHDSKPDDMALDLALKSGVFYIGALGSRKTHAKRCERLKEKGWDIDDLAAIHAPIGLDIGSATPAEIAVSILAQVIEEKNRKDPE